MRLKGKLCEKNEEFVARAFVVVALFLVELRVKKRKAKKIPNEK